MTHNRPGSSRRAASSSCWPAGHTSPSTSTSLPMCLPSSAPRKTRIQCGPAGHVARRTARSTAERIPESPRCARPRGSRPSATGPSRPASARAPADQSSHSTWSWSQSWLVSAPRARERTLQKFPGGILSASSRVSPTPAKESSNGTPGRRGDSTRNRPAPVRCPDVFSRENPWLDRQAILRLNPAGAALAIRCRGSRMRLQESRVVVHS